MTENEMFDLADTYTALREKKSDLDFEIKELSAEIGIVEQDLIQAMTDNECDGFKRNGKNFVLITRNFPSAVPECKAELYEVMKEQGFEHLFTINSNTLQSTLKELKGDKENYPEWLQGLVKDTEKVSIQLRKA